MVVSVLFLYTNPNFTFHNGLFKSNELFEGCEFTHFTFHNGLFKLIENRSIDKFLIPLHSIMVYSNFCRA